MSRNPPTPAPVGFEPDDEFEAWTLDDLDDDLPGDAVGSMAIGGGGRYVGNDD